MHTIIVHKSVDGPPVRINIDDISRYEPVRGSEQTFLYLRSMNNQPCIVDESPDHIDQLISNCKNY